MSGLSDVQLAVLGAVCETLVPGSTAAGAAARAASIVASIEDPEARSQLGLVLTVLANPAANFVLAGKAGALHKLDPAGRLAVLQDWAHSALTLRRAGFQALRRLAGIAYYGWPGPDGSHPTWRATGYPGPLPQPAAEIPPLPAVSIDRDTILDCDVVVVGSGAGGGVVAGVLAQAGRSVIVLEKGGNPGSRDFTQVEGDMLRELYLDSALLANTSGTMPILAGSALGGGTVVNYTTSFVLPERVREEWSRESGLSFFTSPRFLESFARVAKRIDVRTDTAPGSRDQLLERGLRALGWHVDALPRNVTNCLAGLECGFCGYGCRHGAKNSTARTYLRDASARGARLIPHADARRVLIEGGRATGVAARVRGPDGKVHGLTVNARAVVAAAGTINTPGLLVRSGMDQRTIGRGLRLHPASAVVGVFKERVEPWTGSIQTRYSDQLADQDGRGYGVKFETAPVHFGLAASAFGWEGPERMRDTIAQLGHLSIAGLLLRDRDGGRVVVGKDGRPRVDYELSNYDAKHMRAAVRGGAEVLAAAGATEVISLHTPPVRARPGGAGWLDKFASACDARGYTHGRMTAITFHQMGTCAMGRDPRASVAGETGETHAVRDLYVADGSTFPCSSGVNPMLTIMAVADHVARGMAERS